ILLCSILRTRTVAHMRGGNFGDFYRHCGPIFRMFIRFTLRRLGAVILLAEAFRTQFDPFIPRNRQFVLYNSVDPGMFGDGVGVKAAAEAVTVLYVGHLSEAKGFGDVLRSVPLILREVPNVRFAFAGEWVTDERNLVVSRRKPISLRDEWERLSVLFPGRLTLLGTIADEAKQAAFLGADIFFLPSYFEGFPMVILEAM